LGGGWLTGKYQRDRAPTGATRLGEDPERGMEAYGRRNPEERTWRVIEAVRSVAEARGVSMARVALAWLVDRPAVASVILGARTLDQLEDNLGAADLQLSASETALLDQASAPIVDDYPYGDLGVSQRDRALPAPRSFTPNP
jgi:aryl-alcohol dehydrogenase-like predicted oxidoreductase